MLLTMMIKVFCTLALAFLLQAICRHRRPGPCTHTHAFITPHNPESLSTHCGLTYLWALLSLSNTQIASLSDKLQLKVQCKGHTLTETMPC